MTVGTAVVAAILLSILAYPIAIRLLTRAKMGQQIREEGPASHRSKAGTPTAGGLVIVLIGILLYVALDRKPAGALIALGLVLGGGLGLTDDLRAIRGGRNLGLRAREKIVVQLLTGALLGYLALRWGFGLQLVPLAGPRELGVWLVPVGAIAFAAGSNAVNLTDGIDGLAGGVTAIAFGGLGLVAILRHQGAGAIMPAVLMGALIGFLIFNVFPARIFMGDTGSLALGTALVGAATVTGFLWYLPLLGLVLVVETISVIVQVAGFKATGRRIFRMSPLHNHFVLGGWAEWRIALSFWSVALFAALAAVALARPGNSGS